VKQTSSTCWACRERPLAGLRRRSAAIILTPSGEAVASISGSLVGKPAAPPTKAESGSVHLANRLPWLQGTALIIGLLPVLIDPWYSKLDKGGSSLYTAITVGAAAADFEAGRSCAGTDADHAAVACSCCQCWPQ